MPVLTLLPTDLQVVWSQTRRDRENLINGGPPLISYPLHEELTSLSRAALGVDESRVSNIRRDEMTMLTTNRRPVAALSVVF